MNYMYMYTGSISVVKTSISGWHYFGFKITQTSLFVDFLKTFSDGNWSLKVHKNDQLLCGKCHPTYSEATGCKLHWVDFCGSNKHPTLLPFLIQNCTNIGIFKFLRNCFRWKLELKSAQKSKYYEQSTAVWKMSCNIY